MDRKKLLLILGVVSGFFFVCAVVVFILGIALDMFALLKTILIVLAVLCLLFSAEIAYLFYGATDLNPNYFLYDSKTKRNMSVEELTFQMISTRMNRFLSRYAPSEGKLWNDRILDNPYLKIEAQFKPLIGYKLLYGLADKDAPQGWRCLENSSEDTMRFICEGIAMGGDEKFAAAVAEITAKRPMDIETVRSYLIANKKYMQNRMGKYVTENIDRF